MIDMSVSGKMCFLRKEQEKKKEIFYVYRSKKDELYVSLSVPLGLKTTFCPIVYPNSSGNGAP